MRIGEISAALSPSQSLVNVTVVSNGCCKRCKVWWWWGLIKSLCRNSVRGDPWSWSLFFPQDIKGFVLSLRLWFSPSLPLPWIHSVHSSKCCQHRSMQSLGHYIDIQTDLDTCPCSPLSIDLKCCYFFAVLPHPLVHKYLQSILRIGGFSKPA